MDHGKDLNSVTKLLKKLTTVEGEINKRKVSTQCMNLTPILCPFTPCLSGLGFQSNFTEIILN